MLDNQIIILSDACIFTENTLIIKIANVRARTDLKDHLFNDFLKSHKVFPSSESMFGSHYMSNKNRSGELEVGDVKSSYSTSPPPAIHTL